MECEDGWLDVPDVLAFYDYVGHNPAKGGPVMARLLMGPLGTLLRRSCVSISLDGLCYGSKCYGRTRLQAEVYGN